jgi:hypothetical protein
MRILEEKVNGNNVNSVSISNFWRKYINALILNTI